jgi:YebC/PmpR family DNA-binding regulatory protein
MGRAFEFRKVRKMKRWDKMSKTFTRYGKEISMAVKAGGPDPASNSRLRAVLQNAKADNMPKANIEAAIKKASSKDEKALEEMVYECKGPKGVGIMVECATDNPTRTVANLRTIFNRNHAELAKSGSLDYLFDRKGVFTISAANANIEDLELELIDFGLEDIEKDEDEIIITTSFADFGAMQKAIEDRKLNIVNSELQRVPNTMVDVSGTEAEQINTLIEKIEDDDDVQAVYHNMRFTD